MNEGLDEFLKVLEWHLIPLYTFGVKQVPTKDTVIPQGCEWKISQELADKLNKRELTGLAPRCN